MYILIPIAWSPLIVGGVPLGQLSLPLLSKIEKGGGASAPPPYQQTLAYYLGAGHTHFLTARKIATAPTSDPITIPAMAPPERPAGGAALVA